MDGYIKSSYHKGKVWNFGQYKNLVYNKQHTELCRVGENPTIQKKKRQMTHNYNINMDFNSMWENNKLENWAKDMSKQYKKKRKEK